MSIDFVPKSMCFSHLVPINLIYIIHYQKDASYHTFSTNIIILSIYFQGDSEFWRRKMRTLHGILDVNNDGVISFDDYLLLAKKFSDLGHLTPKEYEEFIQVMKVNILIHYCVTCSNKHIFIFSKLGKSSGEKSTHII